MRTFSKIYGLAGLRIGYGIADMELTAAMEKVRQPFNANLLAQVAAQAALDDDEHVQKTRHNNFAGLAFFAKALRGLKLEYVPSSANFILVRVGEGAKVFDAMQRQCVITRPMGGYQLPEWIRISVGTRQENERCLGVLKSVLGL
jgi:histidinol-phosphate aminotransferase